MALAENIRQNGLVNPLIVLNHRGQGWEHHWLMTGTNRHWAICHLGWKTAPCIVTGDSDGFGVEEIPPERLQEYFGDGEVYIASTGPRLRNVALPERYEYPDSLCPGRG